MLSPQLLSVGISLVQALITEWPELSAEFSSIFSPSGTPPTAAQWAQLKLRVVAKAYSDYDPLPLPAGTNILPLPVVVAPAQPPTLPVAPVQTTTPPVAATTTPPTQATTATVILPPPPVSSPSTSATSVVAAVAPPAAVVPATAAPATPPKTDNAGEF